MVVLRAIFAIGWFNTGNYTHAQSRFQRGFDPNVHPPFMVWTEGLNGGCTPFLTGAGGFLQSLVFGTSGMRLHANQLSFNPPPPSATGGTATKISLVNFNYFGSKLKQEVTEQYVTFELIMQGGTPLFLVTQNGTRQQLEVNVPIRMPRSRLMIQPKSTLLA